MSNEIAAQAGRGRAARAGRRARQARLGRDRRRRRPQRPHGRGLPRAGRPIGARARAPRAARRRLHARAAVLRRALRRQPLRLRRRPARRPRDPTSSSSSGAACATGWPTRTSGCRSTTAPRSASGSTTRRPQANLEELGVSAKRHRGLLGLRGAVRRGRASCCARASATPGSATRRPATRSRSSSAATQEMIDLVFEASIADVLDDHLSDERLKTALFGQGIIGTWGGPVRPRHRLDQAHALPGRHGRPGPALGLRRGRHGDGQLRDRRRRRARRARCSPAASRSPRSSPARASRSRTAPRCGRATVICNADPKRMLGMLGDARRSTPPSASGSSAWKIRSPVVKFNAALERLPSWTAAPGEPTGRRGRRSTSTGTMDEAQRAFERCGARRAGRRLRRDLHPDRLRPEPGAGGQAPAERLRPVRALRARRRRLGRAPRRGRAPVHRPDRRASPPASRTAWPTTRSSARPTSSRGSGSPAATSSRAR